ncbi:MAG: hypothetical protein KF687_06500 [Cyclobacteriaceae bacterium]|nr:hypothetical protein [Cyclobacteriaceae bacterium]
MAGVRKIVIEGKALLEVDYSGAKEAEMINYVLQAAEILKKEDKPLLIITIFGPNNYATPSFMRMVEEKLSEYEPLIIKQAIVGLSTTQKILLMGLNIFLQRNFKAFNSVEEGLRYLLDKSLETDLPDHFKKN